MINFAVITVTKDNVVGLKKTRSSLEKQTYTNWTHIVIDGNSKDGTFLFLESLPTKNTFFVSEPDSGIYNAMNKGWVHAEKDSYVLYLNSGDSFAFDDSLKVAASYLVKEPQIEWGCTVHEEIEANGDNWVSKLASPVTVSNQLHAFGYRSHQSVVMKASFIKNLKGFNEDFRYAADWDLIVRALLLSEPVVWRHALARFELGGFSSQNILQAHLELRLLRRKYLPRTLVYLFFDKLWEIIYLSNLKNSVSLYKLIYNSILILSMLNGLFFKYLSTTLHRNKSPLRAARTSFYDKIIKVIHSKLDIEPYN
jgi:glycosyltransferase involved in cell wall biosynthesis